MHISVNFFIVYEIDTNYNQSQYLIALKICSWPKVEVRWCIKFMKDTVYIYFNYWLSS